MEILRNTNAMIVQDILFPFFPLLFWSVQKVDFKKNKSSDNARWFFFHFFLRKGGGVQKVHVDFKKYQGSDCAG